MTAELSLCIINRNDAAHLKRLLTSARPHVQQIVVVDTGSTDDSLEIARAAGADVVVPAPELLGSDGVLRSFSEARELSFSHASCPWRMWLDTDDDLTNWAELPKAVAAADVQRASMPGLAVAMWYDYTWLPDRSRCIQSFVRDRIVHRDDGWKWRCPLHEYLKTTSVPMQNMLCEQIRVVHMSLGARGMASDRNLRILRQWEASGGAQEEPERLYYYLGDEHLLREQYTEAHELFVKSAEIESGVRKRALFKAARALADSQRWLQAMQFLVKITASESAEADYFWELARCQANVRWREKAIESMERSRTRARIVGEDPTLRDIMCRHLGIEWEK